MLNLENLNKQWVVPVFATITAMSTIYTGCLDHKVKKEQIRVNALTFSLDSTSEQLNITSRQLENYIKKEQFDRDLKFKLFSEIKEALVNKNTNQQKVLLVFIDEILANDSLLRNKFIGMLKSSGSAEIREEVKKSKEVENNYYQEEKIKLHPVADHKKLRIDVFYLEESSLESKPVAEKVKNTLEAQHQYEVRLRMLPRVINAQSGYLISANEIRVEEDELALGETIKTLISGDFNLQKPQIRKVTNRTPGYISVFVSNM